MLGVTLQINDKVIAFYEIRRVHPVNVDTRDLTHHTRCLYDVYNDDGQLILEKVPHLYGDRAEALAAKVLRRVRQLHITGRSKYGTVGTK